MKWKGRRIVIAGRFKRWTVDELDEKLSKLGARTSRRVTSRLDYLIAGTNPGSRLDQAETFGVRVLSEAIVDDLLSGRIDEPPPPEAPVPRPTEALTDVLGGLREAIYQPPSPKSWEKICALLDHCEEDHLPLALDYLEQGEQAWAGHIAMPLAHDMPVGRVGSLDVGFELHRKGSHEGVDCRVMPKTWQRALLSAKVDNPRFNAVRVLGFEVKATTTTARNILKCRALKGLRAIFMGYWATDKVTVDLAACESLPALTHVHVSHNSRIGDKGIRALCSIEGLKHLSVEGLWYDSNEPLRIASSMKSFSSGGLEADVLLASLEATEARLSRVVIALGPGVALGKIFGLPAVAGLEYLDLRQGTGRAKPARALMDAPFLETLIGLDLRYSGITSEGLLALAGCERLRGLEHLHLDAYLPKKVKRAILDSTVFSDALKAPFRKKWRM